MTIAATAAPLHHIGTLHDPLLVGSIQSCGVENSIVVACNKLMSQMRAVVESQETPTIDGIVGVQAKSAVRLSRALQRVEAVVMPGGAVGDVPRRLGVVQFCRVNSAVETEGGKTLIDVSVAG